MRIASIMFQWFFTACSRRRSSGQTWLRIGWACVAYVRTVSARVVLPLLP